MGEQKLSFLERQALKKASKKLKQIFKKYAAEDEKNKRLLVENIIGMMDVLHITQDADGNEGEDVTQEYLMKKKNEELIKILEDAIKILQENY